MKTSRFEHYTERKKIILVDAGIKEVSLSIKGERYTVMSVKTKQIRECHCPNFF